MRCRFVSFLCGVCTPLQEQALGVLPARAVALCRQTKPFPAHPTNAIVHELHEVSIAGEIDGNSGVAARQERRVSRLHHEARLERKSLSFEINRYQTVHIVFVTVACQYVVSSARESRPSGRGHWHVRLPGRPRPRRAAPVPGRSNPPGNLSTA